MISSRENEAIKRIRRLGRSKGDHALLEGPHLVEEAVACGIDLELVLATERFLASERGGRLAARLPIAPKLVDERLLASLADADAPRGLIAVARPRRASLDGIAIEAGDAWLYLDGLQDPGNVGALARVAEGLGGRGLLLSPGCADPFHPRALRASAGSLLRLPAVADASPHAARRWSAAARWIGLEAHAEQRLRDVRVETPFVLALGAEGPGLSDACRAVLDASVTLPLAGRLESLNVAVAGALALAELLRED